MCATDFSFSTCLPPGAIPADALSHSCRIGPHDPLPLSGVVDHYVKHLEHHLEQILAA